MTSDTHFDKEDPSSILRVSLQSKTKNGRTDFIDIPNFKKKLYFSYIRMSTGKQTQENSPERQRDYIKLYAKKLGIDYDTQIIEFSDPGKSGFMVKVQNGTKIISKRKGLSNLWLNINACRALCEVFVYDISRYSRNTEIGVTELLIALGIHGKEHQKIEKFHMAESGKVYTRNTDSTEITQDIVAKQRESESKRHHSNTNIEVWTTKKILPKMVAGKLSSQKVFEWVIENGIEWVRRWPNFIHIERAIDMRIEGRTSEEILDYLSSHDIHYWKWIKESIFSNPALNGYYCPKKWKDMGEAFQLDFLDCVTPISREKWEKLQKTMKHRAPYMTRQIDGAFLKPIIHIMRYMWGDIISWHFRFYDKMKWGERYWYIRYRKGNKTLVTVSLIKILREFIQQQWEVLFDIFYKISCRVFEDYYKDNSFFKWWFISKEAFWRKDDIEKAFIVEIKNLLSATKFGDRWNEEKLFSHPVIDTVKELFDYKDHLDNLFTSEPTIETAKEQIQVKQTIALYLVWHWAKYGEEELRTMFLSNISRNDKALIENSKVYTAHLQNEVKQKESEINAIDDRIIEGVITKELLPRANEMKETIRQDILQRQKKIEWLEHSSDIEKYIASLPEIIRKIGELTKKPLTEKDFCRDFPQIVKLLEITCGELTLTKEKALKIGLYEVLERMKDIDNLNWQSSWESNPDQRLWRPLY